jgi:hypothetical protein
LIYHPLDVSFDIVDVSFGYHHILDKHEDMMDTSIGGLSLGVSINGHD